MSTSVQRSERVVRREDVAGSCRAAEMNFAHVAGDCISEGIYGPERRTECNTNSRVLNTNPRGWVSGSAVRGFLKFDMAVSVQNVLAFIPMVVGIGDGQLNRRRSGTA